ncbi:MAG: T9SS type A sorting domain-containing protein, partial [Bacteroidota bacterium]
WIGGLNNPHPSNIDLNGDGTLDVVIAEESGQDRHISFIPFIHSGNVGEKEFTFAPKYERMFDNCECYEWAILASCNKDSLPHVFCGRTSGSNFQLYKPIRHCNDSISYVKVRDPLNYQRDQSNPADTVSVYQVRTDIPAIADVDFDGDLDIITSKNLTSILDWYRNMSVERGNGACGFDFIKYDDCWGHFSESDFSDSLTLADTTSFFCKDERSGNFQGGNPNRHVGSTYLAFDMNGDSLMEILIGDVENYSMNLAINRGVRDDALMTQAIYGYPNKDSAIYAPIFLRSALVDINGDSIFDLVSSPRETDIRFIESKTPMLWHKNIGSNSIVNFNFQDRTFIVDDMVDVGAEALPEFLDYNNDGLMDIMIGNRSATYLIGDTVRSQTEFHMYENVGSPSSPAFQFVSSLYIDPNMGPPFYTLPAPAAGDLDADGDYDLLVGAQNGRIYHYVNEALSGPTADFQLSTDVLLKTSNGAPILVFTNASPELYDYDGDNDLDLFVGNGFGKLYYYENVGDSANFSFELVTDDFGGVRLSNSFGDTLVTIRPAMGDVNGDGNGDLILGGPTGYVEIYTDAFQALTKPLSNPDTLLNYQFRGIAAPAVVKFTPGGDLSFVIGTEEGGLMLVQKQSDPIIFCQTAAPIDTTGGDSTDTNIDNPEGSLIKVFPNPARDQLTISFSEDFPLGSKKSVTIYNSLGQSERSFTFLSQQRTIDISEISEGVKIVRIEADGKRKIQKLIIRR